MRFVVRFAFFFFVGVAVASAWKLSSCSTATNLPTIEGTVIGITDGDTLTVLRERQQFVIRLVEIDVPERGQPFGRNSTQSLAALCAGQAARVQWNNVDSYNRILGRVHCRGVDANAEQVK